MGSDRQLHERLLDLRHCVDGHADWNERIEMVDNTASLGVDGPMILVEKRTTLLANELLAIAEMVEKQATRFHVEAGRLKQRLGAANAPPANWYEEHGLASNRPTSS